MKTWYSCKVKHNKEGDDGLLKQVTEAFLLDAVSYTDAEARINEVTARDISGEFSVTHIAKTNIAEVINYEDSDTWFKCKVSYSTVDGDSEKEVKVNTYLLVCALHVKQAFERIEKHFEGMLVPYDIPSITQTNFIEVYPYIADEIPSNLKPISEVEIEEETEEVEE
ncbi:DUF4494 domain-containing protein [Fulvivirga sp. 29W222]|uniref:DUF4494 domain-containing protein n=1 Tax=Fulvivirga marina TaxID=2494733 RepID=A0A937G2M4_9BACT|nr:DUF4494 domain-containing protein [Fulvivirga marina]MBL6449532.1 DUF4494 domain-containing protein [Fulvivirga marina]